MAQVGLPVLQRFAGQAQGDEVDESALAAAGVALQHQPLLPVELLQRRAQGFFLCPLFRRAWFETDALLRSGGPGEQGRVDRVEAQLRVGVALPGGGRIDAGQGQDAAALHDSPQIGVAQGRRKGFRRGRVMKVNVTVYVSAIRVVDRCGRLFHRRIRPFQRRVPERVSHEGSGVASGQLLAGGFVALLVVGPVADGLDHDPVHLGILAGDVQARSFHLAANRFRCKLFQLLPIIMVVHQLFAGENEAEINLGFGIIPLQFGMTKMIDQLRGCMRFITAQDNLVFADPLQVVELKLPRDKNFPNSLFFLVHTKGDAHEENRAGPECVDAFLHRLM